MNFSSNDSLAYRSRRLSLNPKSKNQIAIPGFSSLPDTGAPRTKRSSIGLSQGKSIKLTSSSRAVAPSMRNMGSVKDIQNAISYLSFKDILKNNNQKANKKLSNYEVRIHVFSNYGHENLITSGEIDILDQNQATIRNVSCSVSINNESNSHNGNQILEKENDGMANIQETDEEDTSYRLVNQNIIKNTIEETWTHSWSQCPDENKDIEKTGLNIKLTFKSQEKPHFVRIFPSPFITEANIKDIRIYINEKFIYEGEINQTFCSIIELQYEGACATDLPMYIKSEDKNMPHVLRDSFGILPFRLTKDISISIIESYSKKTNPNPSSNSLESESLPNDQIKNLIIFGNRKIAFFTTNGETVSSDMMELSSRNIKCFQPLSQLFTDEITSSTSQPWKGSYAEDNEFLISFTNPLPIVAIGILSPSTNTTLSDIRVKKIAVKVNGVMRFVGKLVSQNPNYEDRNSDSNLTFFVYLTNHRETREKIPKSFK